MLKNKKIYAIPIFGFLLMILITSLLLKLPICNKQNIYYIDALFEATSAISATGSNVIDISTQFTFLGQLIILLAMQIGAIGFMLFFSILFMISKKKIKLSDTIFLGNEVVTNDYTTIKNKAKKITKYTIIIEILGTWFLSFRFIPIYGIGKGLWFSIFHSISAFCNVGNDLFGNSLVLFKDDLYVNIVFILLMFFGSFGFFVIEGIVYWFFTGKKDKIYPEVKLIIYTSFLILIIGSILLKIFNPELSIIESIFSVVTAKNTGLYTIEMSQLKEINQFLISIIMFIGGGPGSNAGGIRVVVLAVIILSTIANINDEDEVVIFYRSISEKTIRRSFTILMIDIFIVFLGILGLTITENQGLLDTLFYTISNFTNTGLATIDMQSISFYTKLITIFIMYIGRIAPITFVSLFIADKKKNGIKYPSMDLIL